MSVNFINQPKKKPHHFFIPCHANNHKPHFVRHKALHIYSIILIVIKIAVSSLLFITFPSSAEFSTVTTNRIIELTNQARVEQGLPLLIHNPILDQSASYKADDMIVNNYFNHDSPAGITPWEWFKKAGYNYTFAGENLAMNFSDAEEAVTAWLESPTHKANIMNSSYDEIGVSVIIGQIDGQETTLVVQHFGKSFVNKVKHQFKPTDSQPVPEVEGATMVGDGDAIEVTFRKEAKPKNTLSLIVSSSRKIFTVLAVFLIINLLLTIFIRIKIQHKPIIIHTIIVIILSVLMVLFHLHFIENVIGESVKIL